MKQIGVRDEAKLLADYGDCGKPVCCNNHLVKMPPVSMKMAKLQKATLDPTKISGRCGRLKCCLRYEFDTYVDIQRELPKVGAHIVTRNGKARVIAQQIIAEQLLVETEDHRRILIEASEVLSVTRKGGFSDGAKGKSKGAQRSGKEFNKPDESRGSSSAVKPQNKSKADPVADRVADPDADSNVKADLKSSTNDDARSATDSPKKKKRRRSRGRKNRKDPPAS